MPGQECAERTRTELHTPPKRAPCGPHHTERSRSSEERAHFSRYVRLRESPPCGLRLRRTGRSAWVAGLRPRLTGQATMGQALIAMGRTSARPG